MGWCTDENISELLVLLFVHALDFQKNPLLFLTDSEPLRQAVHCLRFRKGEFLFYGNCDECRKHHAESKRQRPCEKRKKGTK